MYFLFFGCNRCTELKINSVPMHFNLSKMKMSFFNKINNIFNFSTKVQEYSTILDLIRLYHYSGIKIPSLFYREIALYFSLK